MSPLPLMPLPSAHTSLTPARKHRKLLKTSAGTEEVWSEAIEHIFVQGLQAYLASPFASPNGRGRSRWRNQFLVDFLAQNGIERTKKQVASHIQVLRNMWKGQPQFHLVSGGEEPLADADQPPSATHTVDDQLSRRTLISIDPDDTDPSPRSPEHSPLSPFPNYSPDPPSFTSLDSTDSPATTSSVPLTPDSYSLPLALQFMNNQNDTIPTDCSPESNPAANTYSPNQQHLHRLPHLHQSSIPPLAPDQDSLVKSTIYPRVEKFSMVTPGMTPLRIDMNYLLATPPGQLPRRPIITIKLGAPVPDSSGEAVPPCSGFSAQVTLSHSWSDFAVCNTRTFRGSYCLSSSSHPLQVIRMEQPTITAALPESELTRCCYISPSDSIHIVQDIIVDNEAQFRVTYLLDRSPPHPFAQLMSHTSIAPVEARHQPSYSPAIVQSPHALYGPTTSYPSHHATVSDPFTPSYTSPSHAPAMAHMIPF